MNIKEKCLSHLLTIAGDINTGGALAITDGELALPTTPGWGIDLDEDVAKAHVWEPGRGPGFLTRAR